MFSDERNISRQDPEHSHLCKRFAHLWGLKSFTGRNPCPLPCSLDRSSLQRLNDEHFWVSRKLDGDRFQLMLTMALDGNPISILVDRLMNMWEVELIAFHDAFSQGTLIDGELMQSEDCPIFCAFDAITIAGEPIRMQPLSNRLQQLNACFPPASTGVDTNCAEEEHRVIIPAPQEFHIAVKEMRHMHNMASLRDQDPLFPSDGWIFTSETAPIGYGTCRGLLKWKATHTVDFMLNPPRLWNPQGDTLEKIEINVQSTGATDDSTVYECRLLSKSEAEILHTRPDKDKPNSVTTFKRTLQAIADNITEQQLVEAATEHASFCLSEFSA